MALSSVSRTRRPRSVRATGSAVLAAGAADVEAAAGERVKVETVYCLGLCAVGPAAMAGDNVHSDLNA